MLKNMSERRKAETARAYFLLGRDILTIYEEASNSKKSVGGVCAERGKGREE